MDLDLAAFQRDGYAGPFRAFDRAHADALFEEAYFPPQLLTWYKSVHEKSVPVVDAAGAPAVLRTLEPIIGNDILLWGTQFMFQKPGGRHAWHLDVEYGKWNGATVWIALKNLNAKTTISVITRSHLLDSSPQQLSRAKGIKSSDTAGILRGAQELDPTCEVRTFSLQPGEFILWSGRTWHATANDSDRIRSSVIFQYCSPDNATSMPASYDYPGTKWSTVPPPCVQLQGVDRFHRNRVLSTAEVARNTRYLRPLYRGAMKTKQLLGAIRQQVTTTWQSLQK
jgi:Phytanoyl-CoA dioxygenase (PhyH)